MREHIQKLARKDVRASAMQLQPGRPKGEVTVDEHCRLKIRPPSHQLLEAGIPQELVAGADQQMTILRKFQKFVGLRGSLNEWFLYIDVGTRHQSLPRGPEMCPGRCANVHELGFGLRQ